MPQPAGLPYETTRKRHSVLNIGTAGNYEIISDHTYPDVHRSLFIAVYASVLETGGTFDLAIVTDTNILYIIPCRRESSEGLCR